MNESDLTTRREFTAQAVMALLSGVTITISGCGGSSSPAGPSAPAPPGGAAASVSDNHGHTATLTSAEITGGASVTLQIRGVADHPHTVVLTGPEINQIGAGGRVSKTSSTDVAHNHTVTFN
jgi:hypothetical protein